MSNEDPRLFQQMLAKIGTLERRADHLQRQLDSDTCSPGARSFIAAERSALETGIATMRLHYYQAEGLAGPMEALRELIQLAEAQQIELEKLTGKPFEVNGLTMALERASVAATDFEALVKAGQEGKSHDERVRNQVG